MTAVIEVAQLRKILKKGKGDFFISLGGGIARSSKTIERLTDGKYDVYHSVSDTYEEVTEEEMLDSNIGEAIKCGALIFETYS